jgi:hypothetical protein
MVEQIMAAPDTSFHPPAPREERHPGLDLHEHPVSQVPGDAWAGEAEYLAEIRRLAVEADPADLPDPREIARS